MADSIANPIRFEITLSSIKVNAGLDFGNRFDMADYVSKLQDHLRPFLDNVTVRTTIVSPEHALDILMPENASERATASAELLAQRIIDAINRFHERAPDTVARARVLTL
jgi:hypothetical protein